MTELMIRPGRLNGRVEPPPSKSDAHRALIAASLAGSPDLVTGLAGGESDDIRTTRNCLKDLMGGQSTLDCGESGTTLRLLIPIAAALGAANSQVLTFTGHGLLPQRPLGEYAAILQDHGVKLEFPAGASLPLKLQGQLHGGVFKAPGHISSQYISGLLISLPLLAEDSIIELTTPLESAPYVEMTLRTLRAFGIMVRQDCGVYHVPGRQHYQAVPYRVEKDYSQAAFWLTAAYAGSKLEVVGLAADSAQGDKAILSLLDDFRQSRPSYVIEATDIPDLVPILAVAAALTPATTRIVKASRLRLKESDRLQTTWAALQAIGADITGTDDGLLIRGSHLALRGGSADSASDHRIAMALAIAALSTKEGVRLSRAEAVNKSYPDFFREFCRLGGDLDELHMGTTS